MPVIAKRLIQINGNDDLTVSLLAKINSCGCIQSSKLSNDLNIPLSALKLALQHIAGIKCDKDYDICCTDEDTFTKFVKKLEGLK